ncbi:MAG: helix-turn-helix transcriptional regulator [Bacteroidales bacterium]|nr:helix-turn-helix transcriptional regulator [Bacteroidales bacterium]MBN2820405.1 helix-turn-helix transcriptional regulator [Bacteroidales bacterium]
MPGALESLSILCVVLFIGSPFFADKEKIKSRSTLQLALFVVVYAQFVMLMHSFPIYKKLKFLTYSDAMLFYLVMPLIFIYVMKLISDRPVLSARNGINILPSTPGFTYVIYFNSLSRAEQEHCLIEKHCGVLNDNWLYIIGLMSQLFYIILIIVAISKYMQKNDSKLSQKAQTMLQQIIWLMYLFIIFGITVSVIVVLLPRVETIHQVNMFMLCLVFFIVYFLTYIQKTDDLSQITERTEKKRKANSQNESLKHNDIYNQILCFMQSNNSFLNSSLTIKLLSEETKIPIQKISSSIRQIHKSSFPEFINMLRIEYACKRLENSSGEFIKFDFFAKECGFGSRSSFYTEFKKVCMLTPAEFKKQLERSKSTG